MVDKWMRLGLLSQQALVSISVLMIEAIFAGIVQSNRFDREGNCEGTAATEGLSRVCAEGK